MNRPAMPTSRSRQWRPQRVLWNRRVSALFIFHKKFCAAAACCLFPTYLRWSQFRAVVHMLGMWAHAGFSSSTRLCGARASVAFASLVLSWVFEPHLTSLLKHPYASGYSYIIQQPLALRLLRWSITGMCRVLPFTDYMRSGSRAPANPAHKEPWVLLYVSSIACTTAGVIVMLLDAYRECFCY